MKNGDFPSCQPWAVGGASFWPPREAGYFFEPQSLTGAGPGEAPGSPVMPLVIKGCLVLRFVRTFTKSWPQISPSLEGRGLGGGL